MPTPDAQYTRSFKVTHYNHEVVEDPDHSTFIEIELDGERAPFTDRTGYSLALHDDEEIRELIHELQRKLFSDGWPLDGFTAYDNVVNGISFPPDDYIMKGSRSTAAVQLAKAGLATRDNEGVTENITIGELRSMLADAAKSGYQNAWADAIQQLELMRRG